MTPDIFLLDEPSSNLDMASIEDLKSYLRVLKKQGKTILIAEHRIYYLMDIVDRIAYMKDGKLIRFIRQKSYKRYQKKKERIWDCVL